MLKPTRAEKVDSPPFSPRSKAIAKVGDVLRDVPERAHVTVVVTVWEEE